MLKIIVIDDHELIRIATTSLLKNQENIEVLGEAESAEDGLVLLETLEPTMIIIDIDLPGMDGIVATKKMKQLYPDLKVVVLSRHDNTPFPERAFEAGADGYINKSASPDAIILALKEVQAGNRYIDQEVARNLIFKKKTPKHDLIAQLSRREREVAGHVVRGFSMPEIAEKLGVDVRTIFTHRTRIRKKLNIKTKGDEELSRVLIDAFPSRQIFIDE